MIESSGNSLVVRAIQGSQFDRTFSVRGPREGFESRKLSRATGVASHQARRSKLVMQVDTFETVKDNVYDLLGDLAQDFNNEQLDILFSKFEDCNVRPVSNAMKVMDLMRRMAKHDTKARPTNCTVHSAFQNGLSVDGS